MTVELDGNVRMRGDTGPGVGVKVLAENGRLRLVSGNELVGDWLVSNIGVNALHEGFTIKAEGEEFVLRTDDDAAFAEELGVTAVSPRLARQLAVRHNPEEPEDRPEVHQIPSNVAAIGFAVAGALIVLGGTFLNIADRDATTLRGVPEGEDLEFWLAFVIGGVLLIAIAYVMSIGARGARAIAALGLIALVVVFGYAIAGSDPGATEIAAYGFIAGGLVVGVAVLVSGSLRQSD